MNIVVCIKQVPASSNVKVDPETGVLIRDGIESKMNPYDLFALETALAIRESFSASEPTQSIRDSFSGEGAGSASEKAHPVHVEVLTMGPPAAREILLEALYMGADHASLISDRRLGGADVLATAYTLSSAIKALSMQYESQGRGPVDLILCGKQTTDGDTAQVGPEMAEYLDLPQYSNILQLTPGKGAVSIRSHLGSKILEAEVQLPCLLCMDSEINTPRLPSYNRKKALQGKALPLTTLSLEDFSDQDETHYGLKGSATSVERIFPPEKTDTHIFLEGSGSETAEALLAKLRESKII